MALILGAPSALGFVAKCLVLVVKSAAGIAYLTIDLAVRGVMGASRIAWDAMPKTSPPPAYWRIQEDYKPSVRESRIAPITKSLNDQPPIVLSALEISKLAGAPNVTTSVVDCTDEQLAAILGHSQAHHSLPPSSFDPTALGQSQAHNPNATNTTLAPQPTRLSTVASSSAPNASSSAPNASNTHLDHFQHQGSSPGAGNEADNQLFPGYPVGVVSQDAFAGFLSQSVRNIQNSQANSTGKHLSEEEVEEIIVADPAWIPPPQASPGYNARKLEESVDMHASRLRTRDPIVDSWTDVSAPMADQ